VTSSKDRWIGAYSIDLTIPEKTQLTKQEDEEGIFASNFVNVNEHFWNKMPNLIHAKDYKVRSGCILRFFL
jgi:hypothetical protein